MAGVCGEKKGTVEALLAFVGKRKRQLRRAPMAFFGRETRLYGF